MFEVGDIVKVTYRGSSLYKEEGIVTSTNDTTCSVQFNEITNTMLVRDLELINEPAQGSYMELFL